MMSKFEKDLEEEFDEVESEMMDIVTSAFERGLTSLEMNSPVWSGWYQRNHRVSVNNTDVDLEPNDRSDAGSDNVQRGEGQLAVSGLAKRERPKLERADLGDIIYIGNAVPYSQFLEETGTKTNPAGGVYSQAAIVISNNIGNK